MLKINSGRLSFHIHLYKFKLIKTIIKFEDATLTLWATITTTKDWAVNARDAYKGAKSLSTDLAPALESGARLETRLT